MSRKRVVIDQKNARKVYQYFSKALHEKRVFKDDPKNLEKAQQAFIKITSIHDENENISEFKKCLQDWIDIYVPNSTWQRCLATLRQMRCNHKHEVKSIKLNKETYTILKNYADCLQLSLQQVIRQTIEPLLQALQTEQRTGHVDIDLIPTNSYEKTIEVKLWLQVENNSKFVRGKGKVLREIEEYLEEYNVKKNQHRDWEYTLNIDYDDEKNLDKTIYEIYQEMSFIADLRNCFIEAEISGLDGKKRW